MSIKELMKNKATKIRRTNWAWYNYIVLDLLPDGYYGPWGHLHNLIGTYDNPNVDDVQHLLVFQMDDESNDWEEYNESMIPRPNDRFDDGQTKGKEDD